MIMKKMKEEPDKLKNINDKNKITVKQNILTNINDNNTEVKENTERTDTENEQKNDNSYYNILKENNQDIKNHEAFQTNKKVKKSKPDNSAETDLKNSVQMLKISKCTVNSNNSTSSKGRGTLFLNKNRNFFLNSLYKGCAQNANKNNLKTSSNEINEEKTELNDNQSSYSKNIKNHDPVDAKNRKTYLNADNNPVRPSTKDKNKEINIECNESKHKSECDMVILYKSQDDDDDDDNMNDNNENVNKYVKEYAEENENLRKNQQKGNKPLKKQIINLENSADSTMLSPKELPTELNLLNKNLKHDDEEKNISELLNYSSKSPLKNSLILPFETNKNLNSQVSMCSTVTTSEGTSLSLNPFRTTILKKNKEITKVREESKMVEMLERSEVLKTNTNEVSITHSCVLTNISSTNRSYRETYNEIGTNDKEINDMYASFNKHYIPVKKIKSNCKIYNGNNNQDVSSDEAMQLSIMPTVTHNSTNLTKKYCDKTNQQITEDIKNIIFYPKYNLTKDKRQMYEKRQIREHARKDENPHLSGEKGVITCFTEKIITNADKDSKIIEDANLDSYIKNYINQTKHQMKTYRHTDTVQTVHISASIHENERAEFEREIMEEKRGTQMLSKSKFNKEADTKANQQFKDYLSFVNYQQYINQLKCLQNKSTLPSNIVRIDCKSLTNSKDSNDTIQLTKSSETNDILSKQFKRDYISVKGKIMTHDNYVNEAIISTFNKTESNEQKLKNTARNTRIYKESNHDRFFEKLKCENDQNQEYKSISNDNNEQILSLEKLSDYNDNVSLEKNYKIERNSKQSSKISVCISQDNYSDDEFSEQDTDDKNITVTISNQIENEKILSLEKLSDYNDNVSLEKNYKIKRNSKQSSKISVCISQDNYSDEEFSEQDTDDKNITVTISNQIENDKKLKFQQLNKFKSTKISELEKNIYGNNNENTKCLNNEGQRKQKLPNKSKENTRNKVPECKRVLFPRIYSDFSMLIKCNPKTYKYLIPNHTSYS